MRSWNPEKERVRLEKALETGGLDFSAAYMTVNQLSALIDSHPEIACPNVILALKGILEKPVYISQTQSYFLYKAAAEAMVSLLLSSPDTSLVKMTGSVLKSIVGKTTENQHRAASEALGTLPLRIRGPNLKSDAIDNMPNVTWKSLLEDYHISIFGSPKVYGRSIISSTDGGECTFVIKTAATKDSLQLIHKEALWMQHFFETRYTFPVRFEIPEPLNIDGSFVFQIKNLPVRPKIWTKSSYHSGYHAIGFFAPKDYFSYPNDPINARRLAHEQLRELFFRNAWLFGNLTSMGIVHSAPIPLFHNRTQRNRREDRGIYEWSRGGRLDRWLESCRYPNFCITGLRDFEHFITFPKFCQNLYQYIGTHMLSLLLVAASVFRNKDPKQFGYDKNGSPIDSRNFFNEPLLEELVRGIFYKYYEGFTGRPFRGEEPVNFDNLTARMIEEMGVDRHMEEILRIADQNEMTEKAFRTFLKETGQSEKETEDLKRGENDITVFSGPHLGQFNARISFPELIHFLETAAALCIAGRYEQENNLTENGCR